ncbi:hypothetical protein FBU30_010839 [Linnemannia zychae]|nr:hypothetical protein FBU30_010839 [Linnemannia zychae]
MENYHRRPKTSKSKFEDDIQDVAASSNPTSSKKEQKQTTQHHNRPQQHGVMVITPNGKVRTYVTRALEILTEADNQLIGDAAGHTDTKQNSTSGSAASATAAATETKHSTMTRGVLTIKAQGKSITKAVTVAEILKRRMEGSLHQFTEIGQITEQEIWDPNPDQPSLDPITISKHRPTIRIRLSKHLDASSNSTKQGGDGVDLTMPGANIPRDEHADEDDEDDIDKGDDHQGETWPGAILDRDAAARRFVGYQAPTGNDIYL